jgi:hypothetical protein
VEPLSLLVVDTTSAPPLSTLIPARSTGSHQQSTATLSLMSHGRREGQSAERAVGEKRLVKGTFLHVTPFTLRRPLTRPLQPPFGRTLRPVRPGPIESASCPREASTPPAPPASRTARRLRRGTTVGTSPVAPLPQATLGSGSNHPICPLQVPGPLTHCPTPAPTPMSPEPSRQSSAGVTQTTPICHTPSASVVG